MPEQQREGFNTGPGGNLNLENIFSYHAPFGDQVERYGDIRDAGWDLARIIESHCPPSPERSTALAKVREAVMWANAAIACNEKDPAKKCSCTYGFSQAEGTDPNCPVHGALGSLPTEPLVHWLSPHGATHAVADISQAGVYNEDPAKVTCEICIGHLPQSGQD